MDKKMVSNEVKCLLDGLPVPDWLKEENWKYFGLQEARLWNTIPKNQFYTPNLEHTIILDSFEPEFTLEDDNDPMAPILVECQSVLLPYETSGPTTEELRKDPRVIAMQKAVEKGALLEVRLKCPSDKTALPK